MTDSLSTETVATPTPATPPPPTASTESTAVDNSEASKLIHLLEGAELFHTASREPYATVRVKEHFETHALNSNDFKNWLSENLFRSIRKAPTDKSLQTAIGVLQGRAVFAGPERPVHVRLAHHQGDIYLDLGDPRWRVVRVSRERPFEILSKAPVKFRRPKGLLALPDPVEGGSIAELRPFVNIRDDDQFTLLAGWLLAAFRPTGPYPVLEINGGQGSAKSTLSKIIRSLVDPNAATARSLGHERDLMIAAKNGWCLVFDNISQIAKPISDALCRISTGGAFSIRKLYENDEEMLFDAQRPMVLNGIGEFITESDLLDRTIGLELPTLTTANRQDESKLWTAFSEALPRILGALLAGASLALRDVDHIDDLSSLPRMADAAKWVTAGEPAFGWESGSFAKAYSANRAEANARVLDDDPVALKIIEIASSGDWSGTATELLRLVNPENLGWLPRAANKLMERVNVLMPNLKVAGLSVKSARQGSDSKRVIFINLIDRTDRIARAA